MGENLSIRALSKGSEKCNRRITLVAAADGGNRKTTLCRRIAGRISRWFSAGVMGNIFLDIYGFVFQEREKAWEPRLCVYSFT